MSELMIASPEKVPETYKDQVAKLSERTRNLMNSKALPYSCMANFGKRRYTSLEDAADRFDTPEKARDQTKIIMNITTPTDMDEEDLRYMEVKMYQVVKQAKLDQKQHPEIGSTMTEEKHGGKLEAPGESSVMSKHDRQDLQKAYLTAWGVPCPGIVKQCKLETIERQYGRCAKGDIGCMHSKHLIPHVAESPDEKPLEVPRSSAPAETRTESVRKVPQSRRQVDRFFEFWQTLLLMCIAPFRNLVPFVDFKKEDLDNFYTWLNSKAVAGYSPEPTPGQLLWFERQCWSEIEILMCDTSVTLKAALHSVMHNPCLLISDLYNKVTAAHYGGGGGGADGNQTRGRGKQRTPRGGGKAAGRSRSGRSKEAGSSYDNGNTQQRGGKVAKGGKAGKAGKGKAGKGLLANWPANWAKEDPKGTPYCLDFHVKNSCPRGQECPYSHKCPVKSKTGFVCDKLGHTKDKCKQLER